MNDKLRAIADEADIILNGYAFKRREGNVSVVSLDQPDKASLLTLDGDVLETSMDDIEIEIVRGYLARCLKYMEVGHA